MGMESSQEATQIVEMRKIGAVNQLHDCLPSSPLCHSNHPGGSSSLPGSVSVDLSSELHGTLSNQQVRNMYFSFRRLGQHLTVKYVK
jgi:hypothetical protein